MWLLWTAFVIYGSLVPLDFKAVPFDHALSRFLHITLLNVGTQGRADWVANGVLYVPVGFLTAVLLLGRRTSLVNQLLASIGALIFSVGLAVGIEFAQIYFPPRTVSLNDLLAESLGSALGLCLALVGATAFKQVLSALLENWRRSSGLLLIAYAMAYFAFSLFPYDFLVSWEEVRAKAQFGQWGWLLANRSADENLLAVAIKLLAEVLMAIPLGLLVGYRQKSPRTATMATAFLAGIGTGLLLELLQFFLYSGVSQGLSAITRAIGFCLGASIWNHRQNLEVPKVQRAMRKWAIWLALPYLALLLAISGWFTSPWMDATAALTRLTNDVRFVPFYYHYFTTEAKALFSLVSVVLMYAPVGVLAWAHLRQARSAAVLAALLACLVEGGKLFVARAHPDPTNVLIAGMTGFLTVTMINLSVSSQMPATHQNERQEPHGATGALLGVMLLLTLAWLLAFPTQRGFLGLLFTTYALLIWRRPIVIFAAIPAAIPLLDLAPWSGRFFLDEFDWLVMISLAIGYARLPRQVVGAPKNQLVWVLATLLAFSFVISTVRALLPWQAPDLNAFNNYLSAFNAVRISKGVLWACLLLPLMLRANATGRNIAATFGIGMVTGLAGTVLFAVWERAAFTDLLNYASDFRITGPLSAMHTGGAYIECLLTIATPFLLWQIVQTRSQWRRVLGGLLLLGTTYALMVTFSRNGYAAFAMVLVVMSFFAIRQPGPRPALAIIGLVLVGGSMALAAPILFGSFAQSRLAAVDHDLGVRATHRAQALEMRDTGWSTLFLGMGVGRFPATWFWNSAAEDRVASYQLVQTADKTSLLIGTGKPVYIEQVVGVEPNQRYKLAVDLKSQGAGNVATIAICDKWLLTSVNCVSNTFRLAENDKWQHFEWPVLMSPVGSGLSSYAKPPAKLSLYHSSKLAVEFDNVSLINSVGKDIIQNGSFSDGLDHWFFSADDHLAWHTKSMPVAVLFDQGILGVVALAGLLLAACWRSARRAWLGDMAAASVLSALAGFMVLGLFDTLIDSPRFLLMLLMLSWLAILRVPAKPLATSMKPAG